MLRIIFTLIFGFLFISQTFAQIEPDTIPANIENDTLLITNSDTTLILDSAYIKRQEFIRDSILAREKFIQDSIIAREKFVRDSLYQRKLILDSVTFLRDELPRLIEASLKSIKEEIIISTDPVTIIGDSMLSSMTYRILSQKIEEPYAPWRSTLELSGESIKLRIDTVNDKILSFRLPEIYGSVYYGRNEGVIKIKGRSTIIKKKTGNYFKFPIDSVFFDSDGRINKIKKYIHYYEATKDYKKGASFAVDISQIKEFDYFSDGVLSKYKVITYCDRWGGKNENQLCHQVTYTVTRDGRKFNIERKNEPENVYTDGMFTYEFDENFDMKSMEFKGKDKNLNKKCFVELNDKRHVSRYLYEKDGKIRKTILMNYNDDPNAKHKVEVILCLFEDDKICYYQKNMTINKQRKRNRLTLKWEPWE